MDRRARQIVFSFFVVVVLLLLHTGLTGAPDAAAHAALDGAVESPNMAPPAGPTPTACAAGGGYDILILHADDGPTWMLQSELMAQPGVATVDLFDAFIGTPTLADLQPYDLVV